MMCLHSLFSTTPRRRLVLTTRPICSTASATSWRTPVPRRDDLRSVMVIGSGPIVIGQACEFDYSGTQACRVLKAEGLRVDGRAPTPEDVAENIERIADVSASRVFRTSGEEVAAVVGS